MRALRQSIRGETPLYTFLFILILSVFHLCKKKSYLNVLLSHHVSRSQKFKLPRLQLAPMYAYSDNFIFVQMSFSVFSF